MSCSKHPDSKSYYDRSNGRNRCGECVKGRITAKQRRERVTQDILDSLGSDPASDTHATVHTMHRPDQSWAQCVSAITQ